MVSRAGLAAALLGALVLPAGVAAAGCRLALLLAMDVSSSVDAREDALQRAGLAAALRAPEVRAAFLAGPAPVALAAFEWSGRYNQEVLLEWVVVDRAAVLDRAAARLAGSRRSHNDFPTALGHALGFGASMIARAPRCDRATLDVAGDGDNNEGFGPAQAYKAFPFQDITVNGLVVGDPAAPGETAALLAYYRRDVRHGPGAFVVQASGFDDYARAMRAKLVREVSPMMLGAVAPPLWPLRARGAG